MGWSEATECGGEGGAVAVRVMRLGADRGQQRMAARAAVAMRASGVASKGLVSPGKARRRVCEEYMARMQSAGNMKVRRKKKPPRKPCQQSSYGNVRKSHIH